MRDLRSVESGGMAIAVWASSCAWLTGVVWYGFLTPYKLVN